MKKNNKLRIMPPSLDRQRAQLEIPAVPKFPLSSPITEEISTPTSSSSEDRDMERNRPFDFLSKMSSRNPSNQKAAFDRIREFEQGVSHVIEGQGQSSSTSHTARKNPLVGLNLEIPQSRSKRKETAGAFVDLNDLKVLSKAREEERTAQRLKGILKKGDARGFQRLPDDDGFSNSRARKKRASLSNSVPRSPKKKARDDGISPTDRPIVIGYSVPFDSPELQDEGSKELDSAGTQQTPLTPSIIVTPAKEESFWPHLSPKATRPRAASSVYSRPQSYLGPDQSNVPPVPALPALYSSGNDESKSPDSLAETSFNVRKRRSYSTGTINEKDELQATGLALPRSNEKVRPAESLTINTSLNARASHGWWNYILSPLLSRTSTILSRNTPTQTRPPVPPITTNSTGLSDEWWEEKEERDEKEKEISYFSPDTPNPPEAGQSMTGNPFADFDWSIDERTTSPNERGVASMMFSGQRIEGAAAEYYQACAHELFSGTPYFECINHVCSITPKEKTPVEDGELPQDTQRARDLLIDVDDVPQPSDLKSPESGITSINESPSDEASMISEEMRSSLRSRAAFSEKIAHTSRPAPSTTDSGLARQNYLSPESPNEQKLTNPFLNRSRGRPDPTNTHVPPPAPQAPASIHIESAAAPPPANIHIHLPPPQLSPNIHYEEQPTTPFPVHEPEAPGTAAMPMSRGPPVDFAAPEPRVPTPAARPIPPPITMPSPGQLSPPRYGIQPHSPYPLSPESLQESTGQGGSIRMSNMSTPAPAYTAHDNSALPPRVMPVPITREALAHPVTERDRIENRRRRLEREDAIGKKAGRWWRGRGPFSNKGCFGRPGREGRLRRRWYAAIAFFFIAIVVGAVLLAIFLTRKGDGTPVQSQWLHLTGYPPMPTGISTIAGPEAQVQESGCINPTSLWSCALPKEQQAANEPYAPNQPNFRVEIRFKNGTYERSTALASPSLESLPRSTNQLFNPSPSPPSAAEQTFLGRTTEKNSKPYGGEETPFYITVLSTDYLSSSSSTQLGKRADSQDHFPSLDNIIPSPPVDSDGSAAPTVLYPLPFSQPLRLYNRGTNDEHYGFYTYFDKSIFLSSSTPLTGKKDESNSNNTATDAPGGSSKADARVRCTFAETRFLVQIWTRPEQSGKAVFTRSRNTNTTDTASESENETPTAPSSSSATDFTRPGSFPYPVTITLDRHGSGSKDKMVYCYGIESGGHINGTEKKFQLEDRGWNGGIVNPAPGIFDLVASGEDGNTEQENAKEEEEEEKDKEDYGGYDGGSGGCKCQWVNWIGTV